MLLTKRRSRSESRQIVEKKSNPKKDDKGPTGNDRSRPSLERMETVPGMGHRKTSAELISEAKLFLGSMNSSNGNLASNPTASVGGVRLLNTRRPITPRESGRALYGKVTLAGRPPSAFSLKYLRNEVPRTPKTPSLAPIKAQSSLDLDTRPVERFGSQFKSQRSNSLDVAEQQGLLSSGMGTSKRESGGCAPGQTKAIPKKLPSLEVKGIAIGEVIPKTTALQSDLETRAFGDSNKAISILTSRNFFNANCNVLTQSTTEKLIELLKEHAGLKDCSDETVRHICSILTELYGRVRRQSEKNFKRGFVLGGLYGLVECTSTKILLAVARVVLALRVTGSNLTGACKLIFKVARNEQHDSLFYDNDLLELLIDGLGRASPLDDPEACIYGYGSIRFLTSSSGQERSKDMKQMTTTSDINRNSIEILQLPRKPATAPAGGSNNLKTEQFKKLSKQCSLVERLARHGAVELMVLHLQILNEAGATKKLSGPPLHVLYQLSAALRALADVRQISCSLEKDLFIGEAMLLGQKVLSASVQLELACPHLIRAAEISIGELEVQCNIIRTLSILSEDENCCKAMASSTARIGILVGPALELFNPASEKRLAFFSRLGYILGNIMAKYDEARIQFYHNDVAMEYFLKVIQLYAREPLKRNNTTGDTVIDVLVKIIRVVANMSVNSEVGFGLGNTHALGGLLLQLLTSHQKIKGPQEQNDIQELALATLGALHNLCFYKDKNSTPAQVIESAGSLQATLLDVTEALYMTLHRSGDDGGRGDPMIIVEAARVLGNITRNDKARNYFCKSGGLSLIVQFIRRRNKDIDFLDYDLKACAAGVLVNLLGDADNRAPFLKLNGFSLLSELLRLALVKNHDWFLATVVCQAFWNLFIDAPHMTDVCDERSLDEICDLLSDYLDEALFDAEPDLLWEDFAFVATDLLERIQNNFDQENQEQMKCLMHSSSGDQENNDNDEDDVYIEGISK